MNKLFVGSLFSCSAAAAVSLAIHTTPPPESAQTIPYPEVMNLARVPTFDERGMVPQVDIASKKSSARPIAARTNPAPITVDLVSSTVREATIAPYQTACSGCRNLSPTVMVLGYSADRAIGGLKQTMY